MEKNKSAKRQLLLRTFLVGELKKSEKYIILKLKMMKGGFEMLKRMVVLLLILATLPLLSSKNREVFRKDGFTFVYDRETQVLTVSGKGKLSDFEPRNYGVEGGNLKKVIFRKGITYLYNSFTRDRTEEIVIPASLEVIEQSFDNCEMKQLIIPKTVKTIANNSFYSCKINELIFEGPIEIYHKGCFEWLQTGRLVIPEGSTLCNAFAFCAAEAIIVEPNVWVHPCSNGCLEGAGKKLLVCEPILEKSGWSVLNRSDKYLPIIVPEGENWEDYLDAEPEINPGYGFIFTPDGEVIDTYVERYMD